jgi:hypothetical protein
LNPKPPLMTPLAAALGYAALGWRILPSHHNDDHRPHIKGWPEQATTDAAQLRIWWDYWPNATPAVALDAPMVVADLDVKHGVDGTANFRRLTGRSPLDMNTPVVETPSGGLHLLFKCDDPLRNSVGKIAPGIDLRVPVSAVPLPSGRDARRWLSPPRAPLAMLPFVILERAQAEPIRKLPTASNAAFQGFIWPEAMQCVKAAVAAIEAAAPGTQEVTLNNRAYMLGGLVGAGELPFSTTMAALIEAGLQMVAGDPFRPWEEWQIAQKVERAMQHGAAHPWNTIAALEEKLRQNQANFEEGEANG